MRALTNETALAPLSDRASRRQDAPGLLRGDEIFVRNPGLEDGLLRRGEAVLPDAAFLDEVGATPYGGAVLEGLVDGYADIGVGKVDPSTPTSIVASSRPSVSAKN